MSIWLESNLLDLHQSAVEAFPNTRFRQHSVDPVKIVRLEWTPFLGMRTLFLKGEAENGEHVYAPMIMFKGIVYHQERGPGRVQIVASDGEEYVLERIENQEVNVRCDCPDFLWRFNYYNSIDKSLYGRKRAKYEGRNLPANPMEKPGMCKHLMKMASTLLDAGLITS